MAKKNKKDLKRLKELLKVEIKNQMNEWDPLSDIQGIVRGIAARVYDKKKNIKNKEIDLKVAAVKKKRKKAYNNIIKHAKVLAKEYGTWEEVPFFLRSKYERSVPEFAELMNEV
jgi:hypothetical protein